ncbi:MAG: lysoplasmalogenase [Microbacteriaceae bacterium]|nr:lysoplasmalogenase [Microbacteriaceae bacterium]
MQKTMPSLRTFVLFTPYLVVGIVHLAALAVDAGALSSFTKPLLMLSLLAGLLFALPRWRTAVALLATLALVFSWAGDVGIAVSGELSFLLALGFFLVAHVFYIILFLRKLRIQSMSIWSLTYLVWWVALLAILAPHIGSLLIPVAVYGLVLGAMGAVALSCNRFIAIGGALFVVSDTVLALNKFLPGFELWQVDFLIMLSYIAAQGFIAYGIVRWAWKKIALDWAESSPVAAGAM